MILQSAVLYLYTKVLRKTNKTSDYTADTKT